MPTLRVASRPVSGSSTRPPARTRSYSSWRAPLRRAQSRQYHYRAAVTEREVQHSMVGELTERLFDGDVTALVQHLLTGEDVSPGDIAKIRDMIERVETNAPETK